MTAVNSLLSAILISAAIADNPQNYEKKGKNQQKYAFEQLTQNR